MTLPTLYNLSNDKSIISFSGTDAGSFLQGQITGDVLSLNDANSLFSAVCNPKGRVISLFHLYKRDKTYYMVLSSDLSSTIVKRLKMFVFRSDVNIEDVSIAYRVLGVNQALPETTSTLLTPLAYIKYQADAELALVIIPAERYATLKTEPSVKVSDKIDDWQKLLVSACIPEITDKTSELFIPQMLNLDVLDGISFQKGCYTGQEVVARMHYKGSVKRRLVGFHSEKNYASGENIHCANDANSIGTILNCTPTMEHKYCGLIVLKTSYIENTTLLLSDNNTLTVQSPKYNLD